MRNFRKKLAFTMAVTTMVSSMYTSVFAQDPVPGATDSEMEAAVAGMSGPAPAKSTGASSTAELTDFASVDSKDAVALMVKLGLIKGKVQTDNTVIYDPNGALTRAEMAKLIAMACTLVSKETISGAATYVDIADSWAKSYIQYGADKGIISGLGDGIYNPTGTITGLQTAKLLLAAMGVEGLTGNDWAAKTEAIAAEMNLLEDTKKIDGTPIDRDDAAQLIYNALRLSAGTADLPNVTIIDETTVAASYTIDANSLITAPEGKLVTLVAGGSETEIAPGTYADVELVVTDKVSENPSSYSGRGIEDYRAAISIDENGLVDSQSVLEAVSAGTYTDDSASGLTIHSTSDNFTAVKVDDGSYALDGANLSFISDSDGSLVSDFSGLGSIISLFNGAVATVSNSTITTEGVARPALYVDGDSDLLFTDSEFTVMGGTLYDSYVNTADQTKMVAPPWVLGITGNARGTNLMGEYSTTTVVRSDCKANQWGVLSTDAGQNMVLTVVDSTLTLLDKNPKDPFSTNYGSGYGTYIIGNAQEYFYGTTFNVGTYASILTGGEATYASSNFSSPLDIYALNDAATPVFSGITGLGQNTTINSDAFGFMAHNGGTLNLTDNTELNCGNAAFLIKSGDVTINVNDGAKINVADDVILQMIDNDDRLVGAVMGANGPDFNKEFNEAIGYPGIDYAVDSASEDANKTVFNASDVALEGNLYNGTGYFGGMAGRSLEINLGTGTTLSGAISATTVQHVDENGDQNTHFTMDEYYYLGHVANKTHYSGANHVSVSLTDGAVWNVTQAGIISSLTVESGCTLNGSITVNGTAMSLDEVVAAGTVNGTIVVSPK